MARNLIFAAVLIFSFILIASVSAAPLGTFKQGDCVMLKANANCTNVNLIEVTHQNQTFVFNSAMTLLGGQTYNYSFCNTSQLGDYSYSWNNPCIDCSNGECSNQFTITSSGQEITTPQIFLAVGSIFVFIIIVAFFFGLSMLFKHPGVKIFFMAMSTLTLITIIGLVDANVTTYLSQFSALSSVYDKYYILTIILSGAAMLGLIAWFIYYSFTLFNKVRGRRPEEDED